MWSVLFYSVSSSVAVAVVFSFSCGILSVNSLYFLAFVSIISFSKSLRRDLKMFLDGSPVLSANSWRVNSFPSVFNVFMIASSTLFNFIIDHSLTVFFFIIIVRVFQFYGS